MAVQALGHPGPQPVPGFEFNPVDLNKGVGGNFIYIGWQCGPVNDKPVTQIDFEAFREIQNVNPRGDWEWNPGLPKSVIKARLAQPTLRPAPASP